MANPKLSVLLSAFNAEKYIREAVESILNQTFTDFELLIADDGSKDRTRRIIDSFEDPRIRISHNEVNQGKTATINRLFTLCTREFATIHDADDFSDPERLEKQVEFLSNNPDHVACGVNFITILENGDEFGRSKMNVSNETIWGEIALQSQMHGPTAVFRTEVAARLECIYRSYFQDNFEDIDFLYRLFSFGKVANLTEHLYYYRILPDSLCRKNVTVRNRNLYKVVYHLLTQRKEYGKDDLQSGQVEKVDEFFESVTESYRNDSSKIHREAAAYYLYWRLNRQAILASAVAIKNNPLDLVNLRTLLYCIRKIIFS